MPTRWWLAPKVVEANDDATVDARANLPRWAVRDSGRAKWMYQHADAHNPRQFFALAYFACVLPFGIERQHHGRRDHSREVTKRHPTRQNAKARRTNIQFIPSVQIIKYITVSRFPLVVSTNKYLDSFLDVNWEGRVQPLPLRSLDEALLINQEVLEEGKLSVPMSESATGQGTYHGTLDERAANLRQTVLDTRQRHVGHDVAGHHIGHVVLRGPNHKYQ